MDLTACVPLVNFDPLKDLSYEKTALGRDIVDWLAWRKVGGDAARTQDQYQRDLSRLAMMWPNKSLRELTDGDLLHVIASWPPKSRRPRSAAIKSFFNWARKTGRIDVNPAEMLPVIKRTPQRFIDVFTDEEIRNLLDLPVRDGALMALLFGAGLRKSEARQLQVRRVRLEPPPAQVVIVGGKGDKDRVVLLEQTFAEKVRELLFLEGPMGPQDRFWYTRPGGGTVIRRERDSGDTSFDGWWRRCLRSAGVRYRNPHVTRHTFATRYLRRGGRLEVLSGVMGHASIQTTADLYAHLDTRDALIDLALIEGVPE